jgi:hypothetical protein
MDNLCFFELHFFSYQMCTILFKNCFITQLNTFDLKMLLNLKVMHFENVVLTKVVHIYMIKGMNA